MKISVCFILIILGQRSYAQGPLKYLGYSYQDDAPCFDKSKDANSSEYYQTVKPLGLEKYSGQYENPANILIVSQNNTETIGVLNFSKTIISKVAEYKNGISI